MVGENRGFELTEKYKDASTRELMPSWRGSYAAWGGGATIPAAGGKGAGERGGTSAPPHTQFAHYSAGAVLVVSTRRQSQVTPWLKIRENSCAVLSGEPCYLGQR